MAVRKRKERKEYNLQSLQMNKRLVSEVYPTTTRYSNKIGDAFKLYIDELIRNNKSVNTIDTYYIHVNELLDFISRKFPKVDTPTKIKSKHLNDFYNYCQAIKGNSKETVRHKKIAINQFFNYLVECNIISNDKKPIDDVKVIKDNIKKHKKIPVILDTFEIEEFFNIIENSKGRDKIKWIRDFCIYALMINTGMRISEIINLDVHELLELRKNGTITIIGKGGKQRIIAVKPEAFTTGYLSKIDEYLEVRESYSDRILYKKDKHALFISREGTRITARTIQRATKQYIEKASILKNITPHKFRHIFATSLIKIGVPVNVVKELLGHDSILTTQRYLNTMTKDLTDSVKKLNF